MSLPKPFGPTPTERQLKYHALGGFYAFVHFGLNVWTNREWGLGDEKPEWFNPVEFDADQIVGATKMAGLKGLIITAKHHDGFCLWPSKYTEHSVKNSPWKDGKGDVVRELCDACARQGIGFGVYLSPWDRNHADYGRPEYIDYFRAQLRELLTEYGKIFEIWFDGANGGTGYYGGANEERKIDASTYYDWDNSFALIRELQPDCIIYSDAGPDIRWVGDGHAGITGDPCWATYTPHPREGQTIPGPGTCINKEGLNGHRDGKYWMPAEDPMSIRPGWFWHAHDEPRTPDYLVKLYLQTIGQGANLCLNLAPDNRGLIPDEDVAVLKEFRAILDQAFETNLASDADLVASNSRPGCGPENLLDGDIDSYWSTEDAVTDATLEVTFPQETTFNMVDFSEYLPLGQRVENWALDRREGDDWIEFGSSKAIGSRRIWRGSFITASAVRLRLDGPVCPAINSFGVYCEPLRLPTPHISRDESGMVSINADAAGPEIRFTNDSSEPTTDSPVYNEPFDLFRGGVIKARLFHGDATGEVTTEHFDLCKQGWQVIAASPLDRVGQILNSRRRGQWRSDAGLPQAVVIDMGEPHAISALTYRPRSDGETDGIVQAYEWYLSDDGESWGDPVAAGEYDNIELTPCKQVTPLVPTPTTARFLKFVATRVVSGNSMTINEIGVRI